MSEPASTEVLSRPTAQLREVVAFLDDRACIALSGEDRVAWLNGVVTCDVAPLGKALAPAGATGQATAAALYGCTLDVKGRILADVVVVASAGRLSVFVPSAVASALLETWEHHIVMEDCELALDPARRLLWVQGPRAAEVAAAAALATSARLDDVPPGGIVADVTGDEGAALAARLASAGARIVDPDEMRRLRIDGGRGTWGFDFDTHTYVQEAGLEERAVSFTKGCYLGQEVVCTLQSRGKVHRRLFRLDLPAATNAGGEAVKVGDEVKVGEAVAGRVTSVAVHPDGSTAALAMLKTALAAPGTRVTVGPIAGSVVAEAS